MADSMECETVRSPLKRLLQEAHRHGAAWPNHIHFARFSAMNTPTQANAVTPLTIG